MIYNENSKATFVARPINESGNPFTPTSARYRLDDKATGNPIIGWTTLTPSAAMTIEIAATDNTIINSNVAEETKVLTVQSDFNTSEEHNEDFEYQVRNLQFIT